MQIGNHAFGQSGMGISRMGIGQYQNVANKGQEQNAMSDVATMLKRNMDSLEMSPQAQKMMADKNESDNVSAQDVAKENSANKIETPTVTSHVPSAKETLAALGYDMEQMNNAVSIKEEVVTERVIDEGVLQNIEPSTNLFYGFDEMQEAIKYQEPFEGFEGKTVGDFYTSIVYAEDGKTKLEMDDIVQNTIDAYASIEASDASDETKALEKANLQSALLQHAYNQKVDFGISYTSEHTSAEKTAAIDAAKDIADTINSSRVNTIENLFEILDQTGGAVTVENAIAYMDKDAGKDGQLSYEDVNQISEFLDGSLFYATVDDLLGENKDGVGAMTAESMVADFKISGGHYWTAGNEEMLVGGIIGNKLEESEESTEDSAPSTSVEDEVSNEDAVKSEVIKFVQQTAEQTGNDAVVQQMMAMNDSEDDELSNQISDLVFQNNVGTIGS